jgi:hypothetical protein
MTRTLARRLATVGGALGIAVLACAGTASVAAADSSVNNQNVSANINGDTTVIVPDGQQPAASVAPAAATNGADHAKGGAHRGDFSVVIQNVSANIYGDTVVRPDNGQTTGQTSAQTSTQTGTETDGLLSDLLRALD